MYAEWFQQQGCCTLQAANARDAYRIALELQPDVVVTDIKLPGSLNGLDLAARLKSHDATRRHPVLVLTGYLHGSGSDAADRVGCDRFLTKPCTPEVLGASVDAVLRERADHDEPPNADR